LPLPAAYDAGCDCDTATIEIDLTSRITSAGGPLTACSRVAHHDSGARTLLRVAFFFNFRAAATSFAYGRGNAITARGGTVKFSLDVVNWPFCRDGGGGGGGSSDVLSATLRFRSAPDAATRVAAAPGDANAENTGRHGGRAYRIYAGGDEFLSLAAPTYAVNSPTADAVLAGAQELLPADGDGYRGLSFAFPCPPAGSGATTRVLFDPIIAANGAATTAATAGALLLAALAALALAL